MYNFVTAEQSLSDARGAIAAEKWSEAQAAAQALLEKQPENAEAKKLRDRAKAELANQSSFTRFSKAAASADGLAMAKAWRDITDESIYKERGRAQFERVKAGFVEAQANEATRLTRVGRCDDARRVARTISEYFPDARERFDAIPVGCRPAREERPSKEVASLDRRVEKETADTTPAAPEPAPAVKPAALELPPAAAPPAKPALGEAATAAPKPAVAPPVSSSSSEPPAQHVAPRKIVQGDLESLRLAGDRFPSLPAGARSIAHRDNVKDIVMAAEVCVGENGAPLSVRLLKPSDYNDANDKVVASIKQWRFRPYLVDGRPSPVCAPVVLRYSIE
ncbi:MAG TPA: hypothetical protein VKE22_29935 [Haliangiales bacterium]|nr:hypothetical protein [Haliangiales bacterium]